MKIGCQNLRIRFTTITANKTKTKQKVAKKLVSCRHLDTIAYFPPPFQVRRKCKIQV